MSKTSHDHLFKELLGEFFPEFIDLFFPKVSLFLDRNSVEFLPIELFADLNEGDTFETDLVVKAKFKDQDSFFIIHFEHQGTFRKNFDRRVFNYFSMLHRDYGLPVYPIVLFSHHSPKEEGDRSYVVEFPDWEVLRFNYRAIRLNHLSWKDYEHQPNPVASALMATMKIRKQDRPEVKLACLRLMAGLDLNPAQLQLLSGFVDTYLKLEPLEEQRLQEQLDRIGLREKEDIMTIVTSWMQQGIDQGIDQGRERASGTIARQLKRKIGALNVEVEQRLSQLSFDELDLLGEALFDFETPADLDRWLQKTDQSLDRA
jgi:Domain of unknown function (DUF4351)